MTDTFSKPVLPLSKHSVQAHLEAHQRPAIPISDDCLEVWHWVIQGLSDPPFWGPVSPNDVHRQVKTGEGALRWERHTEFWSVTFVGEKPPGKETLGQISALKAQMVTGLRIALRSERNSDDLPVELRKDHVMRGQFRNGAVQVHTDFWMRRNGIVNMVVCGSFHNEQDRGRFVKQLIDLEMYRVNVLKGLTLVKPLFGEMNDLENRYSELTQSLIGRDEPGLDYVIEEYKSLSAEVGKLLDAARYRIAATKAYFEIVQSRLGQLDESPVEGHQSLGEFVSQRLKPAFDTVIAFDNRSKMLLSSLGNSLALYNAIIENRIQKQNQALLKNMEQRAAQQVHLAKAVEGFSVIALTYYAVGLIAYVTKALDLSHEAWVLAFSVPLIGGLVWLLTNRAKIFGER